MFDFILIFIWFVVYEMNVIFMSNTLGSLDCGRRPERPEETQTDRLEGERANCTEERQTDWQIDKHRDRETEHKIYRQTEVRKYRQIRGSAVLISQ